MVTEHRQGRSRGRPVDEQATPALLAAARRLVIRDGYAAVSTQQIAAEAGVARQTLYRRWPGKADLVLDAFLDSAGRAAPRSDLPLDQALREFLDQLFDHLAQDGPAIRSLIASAQRDPAFLDTFRQRFVLPRAGLVQQWLQAAQARGEVDPTADLDMAVTMLHGTFWYRLLLGEPLDEAFRERLAQQLLRGLRAA